MIPQGPAKAVLVAEPNHTQEASALGGGDSLTCSGWPENRRAMSSSGPLGPIFIGVWQSMQPKPLTR